MDSGVLEGRDAETAEPRLRVLVADDHVPTRAGVRLALEAGGMDVCGEAPSAAGAVEVALRERPDVCLLDVHMPGGGPAAAAMITQKLPATIVLMFTVSRTEEDLFESLRRGATGYLLKDTDPVQLPVAIRAAVAGEGVLPRSLSSLLIEQFRRRPRVPTLATQFAGRHELTAREWEVLELLCDGEKTGDIATRLFVSRVTVRRHVSNILRKLGVSSRAEAVEIAAQRTA